MYSNFENYLVLKSVGNPEEFWSKIRPLVSCDVYLRQNAAGKQQLGRVEIFDDIQVLKPRLTWRSLLHISKSAWEMVVHCPNRRQLLARQVRI